MSESIAAQVVALQDLTVSELRERWRDVFGKETRQRHKKMMINRIAHELQRDQMPELSPEEEAKIAEYRELIRRLPEEKWFPSKHQGKAKGRKSTSVHRTPPPGSVITRQYKGDEIVVKVLDDGFEYEGQVYRSLSAIAKVVTGTVWNGPAWFGLRKGGHR